MDSQTPAPSTGRRDEANSPESLSRAELPPGSVRKAPKNWLHLALLGLTLVGLFLILISSVRDTQRTPDFIGLYTSGDILRRGNGKNLYHLNVQYKEESKFLSKGKFFPLDHPPFEAWLLMPLTLLPYRQAYLVWGILNLALLALILSLLRYTGYRLEGENLLAWVAAWFLPVAEAVAIGQDSIFLAMVLLLAFLAFKKRHDFLAGLALGAGLYRFEIILPFVFIFLLRKRGKVLAGFFTACAAAFLASLGMVGWGGLHDYLGVLLAVGRTGGSQANGVFLSLMPSLRAALVVLLGGKLPAFELFLIVITGSLFLVGWSAWRFTSLPQPEDRAFDLQFCLAIIAALLASYHLYGHELTPLILVAFVALGYEREARREGRLSVTKSASLLLLCFLMLPGGALKIHGISLLFFILLGLGIWLSFEISALRKFAAAPRIAPAPARLPDSP